MASTFCSLPASTILGTFYTKEATFCIQEATMKGNIKNTKRIVSSVRHSRAIAVTVTMSLTEQQKAYHLCKMRT